MLPCRHENQITSKVYQGTGLGLAISKELIELMGGFIWLDWSEACQGSRFSFVLPTLESTEQQIKNETSESVLQNANVLIVDDNLHNIIGLTGMITKWGMKPHVFSNGEEALHFTKLTKFDIGLIDICMPKMDGHNFATKLREQKEFQNADFPLYTKKVLKEIKERMSIPKKGLSDSDKLQALQQKFNLR